MPNGYGKEPLAGWVWNDKKERAERIVSPVLCFFLPT